MSANKSISKKRVTAPDPEQPVGRNLYFDKKGRMIYLSPLLRQALYLPKYDYKRFNRYKSRYIAAVASFMVLFTATTSWFNAPVWVSVVIALAIFGVIEYNFYRFQKTLTVVNKFNKEEAVSTVDMAISPDQRSKCWLKIVLYAVLGVLIVVNAYEQNYDLPLMLCCYGALAFCLFMAGSLGFTLYRSAKNAA